MKCLCRSLVLERRLTKPHDMGAHGALNLAMGAYAIDRQIAVMPLYVIARSAARFHQFAVHVNKIPAAGALVQVVDILRDDQHPRRQALFQ